MGLTNNTKNNILITLTIASILAVIQICIPLLRLNNNSSAARDGDPSKIQRKRERKKMKTTSSIQPIIYNNTQTIPPFLSAGPHAVNHLPGLYEFHNVCLTRSAEDESLLGLIYFVPPDDVNVYNNPSRCIPCPLYLMHGWDDKGEEQDRLKHKCGYNNLHAMYATSVSDWSRCINVRANKRKYRDLGWFPHEMFVPSSVSNVHFYKEPMIALAHNMNIGHALWDHLLTILPHWHTFRSQNKFPYKGVATFSVEACLSSNISQWYCELLRTTGIFGGAQEVNMVPHDNTATLHCFDRLLTPFLAYPRWKDYEPESMPSKLVFDEFRRVLYDKFELPRQIDERKSISKKVLFYAHEPSGRRVWTNMNDLISTAKRRLEYKDWELLTVYDFGALSIREQAVLFNSYDVLVMVHGAQMANNIFALPGTFFIELGCHIEAFLGEKSYLSVSPPFIWYLTYAILNLSQLKLLFVDH